MIRSRLSRFFSTWTRTAPARLSYAGGLVSFTFDDFPRSARDAGAGVLKDHGVTGTYYASLQLLGGDGELGPLCTPSDIRGLHTEGHEIACHTYTHLDCARATAVDILRDIARNTAAFASLLPGFVPANFAYPFGFVSLTARRALAAKFASCRGTRAGINAGLVDLAELKANAVYHQTFDTDTFCRLIDETRKTSGWLIFYTHDVRSTPSAYGCTPDELESLVAYATRRSCVLPVGEALARLRPPSA